MVIQSSGSKLLWFGGSHLALGIHLWANATLVPGEQQALGNLSGSNLTPVSL